MTVGVVTIPTLKNAFKMASKKSKPKKPDAADGSQPESKPSGGLVSKLVLAVAVGLVSFGTVFLLPRPDAPAHDTAEASDPGHGETAEEFELSADTSYLELTPFTISLQNNNRILKIGITLEVLSSEYDYIDPSDPKVRDAFTGYLRALRLEQIEDAAFMAQMRAHLLRRAQLVFGQDEVRGILITDFLVR